MNLSNKKLAEKIFAIRDSENIVQRLGKELGNPVHELIKRVKEQPDDPFVSGVLFAAQFIAISHGENTLAEQILSDIGVSRNVLLKAQKESDYETKRMNKIIRNSFRRYALNPKPC